MKILNTIALILLTYISTGWQHKSYADGISYWPDNLNITTKPSVANVWEFNYVVSAGGGLSSGIHSGYTSFDDCKKAATTLSSQHHVISYEVSDCYQVSKIVGIN